MSGQPSRDKTLLLQRSNLVDRPRTACEYTRSGLMRRSKTPGGRAYNAATNARPTPRCQTGRLPMTDQAFKPDTPPRWSGFGPVSDYWIDAFQRSVLFLDVLRQRGNIAQEHNARPAPNVLHYEVELLVDGRTLDRPVNYALVRIVPPDGTRLAAEKRPFIVVDPRAGLGPGIGGMKHDSEIGVALAAGNPCYFVGFLPTPV